MDKPRELVVITQVPGLSDALHGYEGVRVIHGPRLEFAARQIVSDVPPDAIYLEDSGGTPQELWDITRAAQSRRIPVYLGLHGVGLAAKDDFFASGLPITESRTAAAIAAWLAEQLGVRARAAATGLVMLAVAGSKGGIGKSLVVQMLAEVLTWRGARVLVVDGDLSNSGIIPTFHIPPGFRSYLSLKDDGSGAWTAENVQRLITVHEPSGLHFLLGSQETVLGADFTTNEWQLFMQAVQQLDMYDVVLVDTGPEMLKRPYALIVAAGGGTVIFPTPPGAKERTGVGNALRLFASRHLLDRCVLLFMEPEKGMVVGIDEIVPVFAQEFPGLRSIGRLPRAPRQVSVALETHHYTSPLLVDSNSPFTRAAYTIVDTLAEITGLRLCSPDIRTSFLDRLFKRKAHSAKPKANLPPVLS